MDVINNLTIHTPGSLYEAFRPVKAKQVWDSFCFVSTPKHGSWLNMAKVELNAPASQCLNRPIDIIEEVRKKADAWQHHRINKRSIVNW